MKSASTQDRKVREVREILEGLQRYSEDGGSGASGAPRGGQDGASKRPNALIVAGAAAGVVVIAGLAATFFLMRGNNVESGSLSSPGPLAALSPPPTTPTATRPSPERPKQAAPALVVPLQTAMAQLNAGRVRAARQALQALADQGSADAAWALARSFDPNFLRTLDGVDAQPDVGEAKRRYRAWYDIAVNQGLVADSVSLERIIKSID